MQPDYFYLLPFSWMFAVIMIMIGAYSLTLNTAHAKRLSHHRAAKIARFGGWVYITKV
jgi:hypothetical protein